LEKLLSANMPGQWSQAKGNEHCIKWPNSRHWH